MAYSNFVRPVANVTYYFDSIVFGKNWGAYLLTSYAIAACVVGAVYYICRGLLEMSTAMSAFTAIATATSPAIVWQMIYTPSFAFDYLAALWIFLHIIALIHKRYFLAWMLLWLAIFTKEPSFYAAFAACGVIYVVHRRKAVFQRALLAAAYLVPLASLVLLRWFDFRGEAGVYVTSGISFHSEIKNVALGLLHWPYEGPWKWRLYEVSLRSLLAIALSVCAWGVVIAVTFYYVLPFFRRMQDRSAEQGGRGALQLEAREIVCLYFVCSLVMPVVLSLAPRFGATVFPLFFICMGCLIEWPGASRPIRYGVGVLFAFVLCLNVAQMVTTLSPAIAKREQAKWSLSRGFVAHLSQDETPVDFLIGDYAEDFASPEWVKRFSGYKGDLVPVSNVDLSDCIVAPIVDVTRMGDRSYQFRSKFDPGCGNNALFGAYRVDRLSGMSLVRNLPEAFITYMAGDRPRDKVEFVTHDLTITIHPKEPQYSIIVPDPTSQSRIRVLHGASDY